MCLPTTTTNQQQTNNQPTTNQQQTNNKTATTTKTNNNQKNNNKHKQTNKQTNNNNNNKRQQTTTNKQQQQQHQQQHQHQHQHQYQHQQHQQHVLLPGWLGLHTPECGASMGFNKLLFVVVVAFTLSSPVFQLWGFASVLFIVFARPCVPLYLLLVVNFQFQSVTHSGNFYQACFLHGFVTVVLLKPGLLSSHAGAWSQPGLLDPFAKLAWLARRSVEPAWLLDPCVSLLVLLAEWSILLENYCQAGCVRTPERGATALTVTLWNSALVRTLGRGASLTLQVFLLSLSTFLNPASAVLC